MAMFLGSVSDGTVFKLYGDESTTRTRKFHSVIKTINFELIHLQYHIGISIIFFRKPFFSIGMRQKVPTLVVTSCSIVFLSSGLEYFHQTVAEDEGIKYKERKKPWWI